MRFLEKDEGGGVGEGGDCADCESHVESSTSQDKLPVSEGQLYQILEGILFSSTKLEESLLRNVTKYLGMVGLSTQAELLSTKRRLQHSRVQDAVGANEWESFSDYKFIDVMVEVEAPFSKPINAHRLLVDIDFRLQFEIAQPI